MLRTAYKTYTYVTYIHNNFLSRLDFQIKGNHWYKIVLDPSATYK